MAMNNCCFTGNLVNDPVYFEGNAPRVLFTLAVDHNEKQDDGKKKAEFLDFIAWRGIAEFIHQYCHKGDRLSVTSEARNRITVDDSGVKNYRLEFHVNTVNLEHRQVSNENNESGEND